MMLHGSIHTAPSLAVLRGLMRHRAPAWAVLVKYPGPSEQWHVWAGHHSVDEAETRRSWKYVLGLVASAVENGKRMSAALVGPLRSAAPADATPERGVQLTLAPGLGPKCRECLAPLHPTPGRPGRPRAYCTSCRPPTWPRRGEHWLYQGEPVVVLGSSKRDRPRIRVRPLDSALVREIPGEYWSTDAVRLHPHLHLQSREAS